MQLINTIIYSNLLKNIDPEYQKFNGSSIYYKNNHIIVWRAQNRPTLECDDNQNIDFPTYPYITMDGKWEEVKEYLGILIINISSGQILDFIRYQHNNDLPAEDPRIYLKNDNNVYISYNARSYKCPTDELKKIILYRCLGVKFNPIL